MTRKYQEGGQLTDTQQQGLQYLAQMYAQQTGKDPQQDQEGFMQFVQQLAQQAGVQDIGQLLDMVYQQAQGQAQAARRGAKLNYLRRLTGKCPEGYELQYFKAGGRVCSQCVAKKKIEKEACGKKVKKNYGGKKIKFQNGDKINDRANKIVKDQYPAGPITAYNPSSSFPSTGIAYTDILPEVVIKSKKPRPRILNKWTPENNVLNYERIDLSTPWGEGGSREETGHYYYTTQAEFDRTNRPGTRIPTNRVSSYERKAAGERIPKRYSKDDSRGVQSVIEWY